MQDRPRPRLGRVATLTLYALCYRPVTALLLAFVTLYIPILVAGFVLGDPPRQFFSWDLVWWALRAIPFTAIGVTYYAWIAFQLFDGNTRKSRLKEVLSRGNSLFFTNLIVVAVATVGIMVFVLPGALWGLACTVALPVAAVERLGPRDAIKRSFELTAGHRWSIFGLSIALFLPLALLSFLIELAVVGGHVELLLPHSAFRNVADPIQAALNAMVGGAFAAAIYNELLTLRQEEDPPSVRD